MWVLSWRSRFLRDPDGPLGTRRQLLDQLRGRRVAAAAALCVVIAGTETMTTAFTLVALAVTGAVVALRRRDAGVLAAASCAIAVIGLTFLVLLAPTLWYWHGHGTNPEAAHRVATEQERFGLQPSQLLLPIPDHRPPAPTGLQAAARKGSPLENEGGQELGVLGAVGLVVLLYRAVACGIRRRTGSAPPESRSLLVEHGGLVTMVLILFSTVSGFALLLSIAGFSQVRVWDRSVTFIGFFALLTVAAVLERLLGRPRWSRGRSPNRRRLRPAGAAVLVVVLLFGLWDTAEPTPLHDRQVAARASTTRRFMDRVEARLPSGARIFQLPVVPFPENPPVARMQDYDELWPYLWSQGLRFSYGAMKGRPQADWQQNVSRLGPSASLPGLRGLGFDAVLVDTAGFADGGRAVSADLTSRLGPPEVVSSDGRLRLWDLRDLPLRQHLTDAQLQSAARQLLRVR